MKKVILPLLLMASLQASANIDAVDFTPTLVCEGSQTTFSSTSVVSGGATIIEWNWDLDADGQFDDATGPNVNQLFTNSGTFNVGLQIVTDQAESAAAYKIVTVNAVPSANFSATAVCDGNPLQLEDQSTISSGSISTWQWDLDNDGQYDDATGSTVSHSPGGPGSYTIGLQVTSDAGCQSTTSKTAVVHPVASVAFSADNVCLGDETELTANTSVASGSIVSHEWELNENNSFDDATGTTATQQFISDGNHQIGLRATTDQGCVSDTFQLVTIAPFPIINYSFDNACQDTEVPFTNTSNNAMGTITYDWQFGQFGSSIENSPSFTFPSSGATPVQLIGTTSFGCSDTLTQTVQVHPAPDAAFSFTEVCIGQTTNFTNITDPKGSTIQNYSWDLGDQNTSENPNPFHTYIEADSFLVSMVAYTTDGCRDTAENWVNVWPLPNPEITADGPLAFCDGEDVTLTVNPVGSPMLWSTGETGQSITVTSTGNYEVLITDENGCQGEEDADVETWELPELVISNDTTISLGEDVPLFIDGASFYTWSPSTYLNDPLSPTPISENPMENITYDVLGTDVNGCESTISVSIEVLMDYNLKPVTLFTPNNDGSNDRFYIGNIESYSDCTVKVYNRWGLEVYASQAYLNDWRGRFNGDILPEGTYYYVIECDGMEDRMDGAVTILR